MIRPMDNIVYVYDKHMNLLAQFNGNTEGYDEEEMRNLMIAPTVHLEQNGASTLTFQMLYNCEKWHQIKDPENIYELNGRYYTPLNEGSYKYVGKDNVRLVDATLVETWFLLDRKFTQVYNCGLYCYAKATFQGWTTDGAIFRITSTGCSNPGNTISTQNAWNQVKLWQPTDSKGNSLTYTVLKAKEYAPSGWEDAPSAVAMQSFTVTGNTATAIIRPRASTEMQHQYEYVSGGSYQVDSRPYPATIKKVYVNSTITVDNTYTDATGTHTKRQIITSNKTSQYSYSSNTGRFSISYRPASNETINYVIAIYDFYDMGEISSGATCTFAYGAEVVDEHTFLILPKADKKYKLTIDGVEYDDNQVKDSRGVIQPRGSAGYALWALLHNTGWKLGICDVIAKDFDASVDYGCFNIESDMRDVLYNVNYIQELYGGILDWDSKSKTLNYRAEDKEHYQYYNDGFNDWTGYEFREGKNMKDQPHVTYDNSLTTKAYIIGYGNLNFKKINNGKAYVEDYSYTTDVYEGYLEQPLIYDTNDEGGQRQLLYWGQKEIAKHARPRKTISINATDVRTVEGLEHEVFDIHNIVRVYYYDDEDKALKYEDQRITLWEYNAFALWDSTVELGDKTQNLSELFKLIYDTSIENAPKTNASHQISSDEVIIEMDLSEYGFDSGEYGEWTIPGGGSYGYGGGYGLGSSLTDYISLIAQKTTANSDAVAGLVIQATDLYSQVDLFAQYRKQTDEMISETYSGLKLYADEKSSSLEAVVSGNYQTLNNSIQSLTVQTQSGFQTQQTINESYARQFAQYNSTLVDHQRQITTNTSSIAQCITKATYDYAEAQLRADFNRQITSATNGVINQIESSALFRAYANGQLATVSMLASYANSKDLDNVVTKVAGVEATANAASASVKAQAQTILTIKDDLGNKVDKTLFWSVVEVRTGPPPAVIIKASAATQNTQGYMSIGSLGISLYSSYAINLTSHKDITISSTGGISIGNAGTTTNIYGTLSASTIKVGAWTMTSQTVTVKNQNGTNITFRYLGTAPQSSGKN